MEQWWLPDVERSDGRDGGVPQAGGSSSSGSTEASKQKNPFARAEDEASPFDQFLYTQRDQYMKQKGSSPGKRLTAEYDYEEQDEEDEELNRYARSIKRLKSLDLPMDMAKELVDSMAVPKTNSKMFGVLESQDRVLYEFGVCASQGPRVYVCFSQVLRAVEESSSRSFDSIAIWRTGTP